MILQTGGYDFNTLKFAPYLDITIDVLDQVLQKSESMLCNSTVVSGGTKRVIADVEFVRVCQTDQQLTAAGLDKELILGHEVVCQRAIFRPSHPFRKTSR
jgi:hypothetical protein